MQANIRNFCIIAHIDHGKSTLADRLLEYTGTIEKRQMQAQLLDSNPIERERGITIKLAPVRMLYKVSKVAQVPKVSKEETQKAFIASDTFDTSDTFILNLIDTPGHVDFNYEVSRSLAACEGAILVVDATQGVQAQTLANFNLAKKQNLVVIPVLNKIDLPNAQVEKSITELENLGFHKELVIPISAKLGTNIDKVLEAIIKNVPPPQGELHKPLRGLIFSSQYDTHKGVVVYVRIVDGELKKGDMVSFMASKSEVTPIELGYFMPTMRESEGIKNGEVGYIATGLKDIALAKVGDTVTLASVKVSKVAQVPKVSKEEIRKAFATSDTFDTSDTFLVPLAGYKEPKPMVFLGLYPIQNEDINEVRDALGKLRLSDSAFTYKPIYSQALGNGFHCGFLGLLHAEVVQERLTREFNLHLLATSPTVEYKIRLKSQNSKIASTIFRTTKMDEEGYGYIQSAAEFPDPSVIEETKEPIMQVSIFSPKDYVGAVMKLCQEKRGEYIDMEYISEQVKFTYLMPLSEMIINFFDELKSATSGYATLDYEFFDHQKADVVKLDIVLNHEKVDAFSQLVVSERASSLGHTMTDKLKDLIPRQQFSIPIQAAVGGDIIARSDVKPFRKDVTQKLYGGDRTRKDKLLEAQKKGKAKMKQVGRVEIPQEAFLKVFKAG